MIPMKHKTALAAFATRATLATRAAFATRAALATLAAAALLVALARPAQLAAASPNNDIITIVPPAREGLSRGIPTAIALMQPADYVCAIVEITSNKKNQPLAAQVDDLRQTAKLIAQAVEKTPDLSLHNGPVRFSPNEQNFMGPNYVSLSTVTNRLTSFVSGSEAAPAATRTLRILCKLASGQDDTLDATLALHTLVNNIKPTAPADVRIRALALAVNAPELQREQLLRLIRNSADAMSKTFSAARLTIDGLQNPVLVRQVSDTQVELYIDYTLSVATGQ